MFLSLGEEAVAASSKTEAKQKSEPFAKLWAIDDGSFSAVKGQYTRMLSSTPDARALQWKEKMGIGTPSEALPATANDAMEVDS